MNCKSYAVISLFNICYVYQFSKLNNLLFYRKICLASMMNTSLLRRKVYRRIKLRYSFYLCNSPETLFIIANYKCDLWSLARQNWFKCIFIMKIVTYIRYTVKIITSNKIYLCTFYQIFTTYFESVYLYVPPTCSSSFNFVTTGEGNIVENHAHHETVKKGLCTNIKNEDIVYIMYTTSHCLFVYCI
jgi:hypothetical protein